MDYVEMYLASFPRCSVTSPSLRADILWMPPAAIYLTSLEAVLARKGDILTSPMCVLSSHSSRSLCDTEVEKRMFLMLHINFPKHPDLIEGECGSAAWLAKPSSRVALAKGRGCVGEAKWRAGGRLIEAETSAGGLLTEGLR